MSKRHKELFSMPFMVERYMAKTKLLTLEEHGAYLLLLCEMWCNKGSLRANDDDLARLLRLSPEQWQRLKPRLWGYLTVIGEGDAAIITQDTLQEQWNYAVANSERQKKKGSSGAKKRWRLERERKAIASLNPGNSHGHTSGDATSNGPAVAILRNNYNNNISQKDTDRGDNLELPECLKRTRSDIDRLMKLPRMKAAG